MNVTVCEKFKGVLPEWTMIACGIALLMCLLFLVIAMLFDETNHDTTIPLWISTVFLAAVIILLLVGAIFHEEVPDGKCCVVKIGGIDWEEHGLELVTEEESGKVILSIREPG